MSEQPEGAQRVTTQMVRVLDERGELDPASPPAPPDSELRYFYLWMLTVRTIDGRMMHLQRQGRIAFYGPITGQEATVVGSVAALGPQDWVFPALREYPAALMRGMPLSHLVHQCYGTALDVVRGRQMPCHYSSPAAHYVAMSSCIGTQVPHAVGAAMAARIRGEDTVAMAYMGDGATSEPDVHAALNFAGVYRAPVVLFCQNNGWAITVPVERQTAASRLVERAEAYGMPGVRVDGNDVLAVHRVTLQAVERARSGGGPTFIEAVTYRMLGHTTSDDPSRYRDPAEVEAWRGRDPLLRMRRFLEARGLWGDEEEAALLARVQAALNAAIEAAEAAPRPPLESLFDDVYAEPTPELERQLAEARGAGSREGAHG
ncbi:MAG: pyruvate dehydrogenase (acetyl-transferring) E1 component subunit alpha [Planctomycetes bacterium]|nr:pyruvate dehydrogenase (acetyl-transferring) E1 component subunit alpha [Planctomycetota bacterium]